MRTTIYDIAKLADVSGVTVSRVLNNANVPIAPETRERILRIARELNYTPNRMARALVTGKTNTLALIATSIDEMLGVHYNQLLESVHMAARESGRLLITSDNVESVTGSGQVDGIIWLANPETMKLTSPAANTRLVYVWQSEASTNDIPNSIAWNDAEGIYGAVRYLLDLGHRNIAAIWGDIGEEYADVHPKVKGYRKAMAEAGLDICEVFGEQSADQCENGCMLMDDLLRKGVSPSAVIARNDFLAVGTMKALKKHGLRIPEDVSVIGYNDIVVARCSDPALTSVRTPMAEAGAIAVTQLLKIIDGEIDSFPSITLKTSLSIRETCASVPV